MTTRDDIVTLARSFLGYLEGPGNVNEFSSWLGRPPEAWCGDFATEVYRLAGLPLPSLQPGCSTGFAAVGIGFRTAQLRGALRPSTQAQPGDLIGFQWDGAGLGGDPDHMHVEVCADLTGNTLTTIGGNSGPSPTGLDGVHEHTWTAGGPLIIGAIDTSRLVQFTPPPPPTPAPVSNVNPWYPDRLVSVHNHPTVWEMRLRGRELVKAPVPSPTVLAQLLAQGLTAHEPLIDKPSNNAQLAAIPTVPWT